MNFISSPITYEASTNGRLVIARDLDEKKAMLDNLIEMIVFTPKGSFVADPDFGFEYWKFEYSNFSLEAFNTDNTGRDDRKGESDRKRCLLSIKESLQAYAPWLTNVKLDMRLGPNDYKLSRRQNDDEANSHPGMYSRHSVAIEIKGNIYDNLGTTVPYTKTVEFLVEPTVKR